MCGAKEGGLSLDGVDVAKEAVVQGQVLRDGEPVPNAYVRLLDRTGTLSLEERDGLFDLPASDPLPGALSPGIAMYVARRLIEAMRGTTWVTEGAGGSVEIGFSLPCYESAT